MTLCSKGHAEVCFEPENGGCPVCELRARTEEERMTLYEKVGRMTLQVERLKDEVLEEIRNR